MFSAIRSYSKGEEAQKFVYDAWEATDPADKFALCQQALSTFPFLVDAYNCLGQIYQRSWHDIAKAEQAYRYAMECGHLLWPELKDSEEILWGRVDCRPYLRTYHGLGMVLEDQGKATEAIKHYRYLLRVNPSDNQGVRFLLFQALIGTGDYREAEEIAEKHSKGRHTGECYFAYGYVIIDYSNISWEFPQKSNRRRVSSVP